MKISISRVFLVIFAKIFLSICPMVAMRTLKELQIIPVDEEGENTSQDLKKPTSQELKEPTSQELKEPTSQGLKDLKIIPAEEEENTSQKLKEPTKKEWDIKFILQQQPGLEQWLLNKIGRNPLTLKEINDLKIMPDKEAFVYCSNVSYAALGVFDLEERKIKKFEYPKKLEHAPELKHLAITSDGKKIVTGSKDSIILWDVESGKQIKEYDQQKLGHSLSFLRNLTVSPDNKKVVLTMTDNTLIMTDNTLIVLDMETDTAIELAPQIAAKPKIVITPDSKKVIGTTSSGETAVICNIATGEPLATLSGHTGIITSLALTSDGKMAFTGSDDKTIKIWNVETGILIDTLKEHTKGITCMAITPDNNKLITGSKDHTVITWDLQTKKIISRNNWGEDWQTTALTITPDGQKVIINVKKIIEDIEERVKKEPVTLQKLQEPNVAIVYDIATGRELAQFAALKESKISYLATTSDSKKVVMRFDNDTATIKDIKNDKLSKELEDLSERQVRMLEHTYQMVNEGNKFELPQHWEQDFDDLGPLIKKALKPYVIIR